MSLYVVAEHAGGPEVLEFREEPDRAPGPGEVTIDVRAIGVNPVDVKQRKADGPVEFPFRPGHEVAGVVTAVGAGVGFATGDEVVAFRIFGGYTTRLVAPAADVFLKPANLSFDEASGLLLVGVTAVHALTRVDAHRGDTVLVHGASGSVGQALIQVAVADGIRVIGTTSDRNADLVRSLGAEPIPYGGGIVERVRSLAPDGIDAAIDLVGTNEAIDTSLELVADHRRVTTIVGGAYPTERGIQKIGRGVGADPGTELRDAARQGLIDAAARGEVVTRVVARYPLSEAAAAQEFVAAGHAAGKVVLIP
jgi:NADPH:quinone reductase-like Zn-dependent oxidoreductase